MSFLERLRFCSVDDASISVLLIAKMMVRVDLSADVFQVDLEVDAVAPIISGYGKP